MTETIKEIGIIILAAGSSSRFGSPKQLLKFEEKSLIRRAVKTALNSGCPVVAAVLGANSEIIKNEIRDSGCKIVFNPDWQTGMSSSIKIGLAKLLETAPDISAVIIALCDQPLVESEHFKQLAEKFSETKKPIITSVYNETTGVPALFAKEMFPALLNLEGDHGAKDFINENSELVEKIFVPEAAFDIDTKDDFEKLRTKKNR